MSLRLHVVSTPSARRQGSPIPAAEEMLYEDEHAAQGWRRFYAIDPVTHENIGEARCRVTDDATGAIDWLQQLVEHHLAKQQGRLRRAD